MKKKIIILFASVAILSTSNCLLTDAMGVQPDNSVPGAELKKEIGNQAALGWTLGCESYFQDLTGKCTELNGQTDVGGDTYPTFPTVFIMVQTLAAQNAEVNEGSYYKAASAEACSANAFSMAFIWTLVYLESQEKTVTGGVYTPASAYIPSTLLVANLAADCEFEKTGDVVELGPLSL